MSKQCGRMRVALGCPGRGSHDGLLLLPVCCTAEEGLVLGYLAVGALHKQLPSGELCDDAEGFTRLVRACTLRLLACPDVTEPMLEDFRRMLMLAPDGVDCNQLTRYWSTVKKFNTVPLLGDGGRYLRSPLWSDRILPS